MYIIVFKFLRERSPNFPNQFYGRFLLPKYEKKTLKIPKEDWETRNIKQKVQAGLHLYETERGEFLPMDIQIQNDKPTFRVLNQEQRWFAIKAIRDVNSLTKDKKRELMATIAVIVGLIVFGIVFVFGMIWMSQQSEKQITMQTQVCAGIIDKVLNTNLTQVQNGKATPGFLNDIVKQTVGG
jgi:hypothetical protein